MAPLLQGTQINIRVTFMLLVFDSIPVTVYQAKMQYNAVHRHGNIDSELNNTTIQQSIENQKPEQHRRVD